MTRARSLRWRFFFGSILWAVGLVAVVSMIATALALHYPHLARTVHHVTMSVFALVCILAGVALVRRGLSPLTQLRMRLAAVRDGTSRRVEGSYPAEVEPLVDDLNALLEDRERRVARAVARAGDLAHGLKTPLAVMSREAERARAAGQEELAFSIAQEVERMNRQLDYHLAQARAAASVANPAARCSVAESAEGLCRALRRLHADRGLTIDVAVLPEHMVRGQREDLDEMLGNLLDNACKWAKSCVRIQSSAGDASIVVTVDDDGPGIAPSMRDLVLQRGMRADEAAPGSGFGLAIVRDLAELYGGSISLESSPLGGTRARLELPAR